VAGNTIALRFARLPGGLTCYPRVLFTSRPALSRVTEPPPFEVRVERVRISSRRAARYAEVCGFEASAVRAGYVPLTYPHVLAMPLHLQIMARSSFPLRPMGLIHLANAIDAPGELRVDVPLSLVVRARNYRPGEAGLLFDMDTEIIDAGHAVWRESCTFLSRWPESVERPSGRPPRPPKAPKDSEVLAEFPVTVRMAWAYAWVSKDFNPIHLHDRPARYFGLRGVISHGMWSLARTLAQAPLDPPPSREARLETQFLTPVQLPARVNIKRWIEGGIPRRALCDVRTGRVHMLAYWKR
jgi:acyl dehydratase